MAHPGKLDRPVDIHYDPTPSRDAIDGLGATNNRPVGSQTLVETRAEPPQPALQIAGGGSAAPVTPPPAESTVRRWVKWFVGTTVVPAVNHLGTEWLVQCAPEDYQWILRPVAHVFDATVVRPASRWLSDRLIDALSDPRTFKDNVQAGLQAASADPIGAIRAALPTELPGRPEIGRAMRDAVLGVGDGATASLLTELAARAVGHPELATVLRAIAPHFGTTVRTALDFGFDLACPMEVVAKEDVPKVDDALTVCSIFPATVTKVAGTLNGRYDASVTFQDTTAHPWVSLAGTAIVTTGEEKRIVGVSSLAGATLTIGKREKYAIRELASTSYGEHTGWSLSAGAMVAIDDKVPATLSRLTVSPIGWIDGAFVRGGKPGHLGGKAPDGVQWPIRIDVDAGERATPAADDLTLTGDHSTLATGIHSAITTRRSAWLAKYPMLAVGWATDHANLIPKQKDPVAETGSTLAWLSSLDPTGLLADIASIDLVPSFLRSSYPKLGFHPYELMVGREPSLSFGMTTTIQLFKDLPAFSANQVVVAWLPWATPSVQLRAGQIAFGDALEVFGLELDPDGGVRTPHARMKIPMPTDTFSIPNIVVAAEYLRIGRTIDFRSASMAVDPFAIGNVVNVKTFEIGVSEPGNDPRLTAAVGGDAHVPDMTPLTFKGTASWGAGKAAEGSGEVRGEGLSAQNGRIKAQALAGTLEVEGGAATGELTATDLTVAYKEYSLKTTAVVVVDRRGLASFSIKDLTVWKGGVQVGAASNVVYERDKTLTIGALSLDLPETGSIRATKAEASGEAPRLTTTDLDLSSLIREPAKPGAPKPAAPAKAPGIAVSNLARLELGPSGSPFLALDFTRPAPEDVTPGAVSAVVSGNLRRFKIPETLVEVGRSATSDSDVRVKLANIDGAGYSIKSAIYDDGVLEVSDADVQLDVLLGSVVPEALRGLASSVKTTFTIDTRHAKLLSLGMQGSLDGTLFGGAVTVKKATATLAASPGAITADSLTSALALSGNITGTVLAKAYGIEAELDGSVAFPGGTPKFSGRGSKGSVAVEVTDVSFRDGKPIFGSAMATIGAPDSDFIKFVAWKDKLKLTEKQRGTVVILAADRLEVEPDSGLPVAAAAEQVIDAPSATPPAQARKIGVHLPEIQIHGDVFRFKANDFISPEAKDQRTVTVSAEADLKLGMLRGGMQGTVTLPLADDAAVDPRSIAFEVTRATLGGLVMTGLRYEHGRLKIASTTVPTPTLLGGMRTELGLDELSWTATNLEVDLVGKALKVEKLATTVKNLSCLGGALSIGAVTAEVGTALTPVDGSSLIPQNWALTLTAADAKLGSSALAIGGSAKLVIDRTGVTSGEITGATLKAGIAEASVGKIDVTNDGWSAEKVSLVVGNDTKLGFDPVVLPSWLSTAAAYQVRATFPLSYKAGKGIEFPSLSQVEIDVLKAGLALPGITGSFERTKTKRAASFTAKPPKGGFSVGLQIPLAHGVGIEIGGSLEHEVSLDAKDVALADGENLAFSGKVAGHAALKGRVRVGVFGGVPALFTVSAGLYAGLDLSATLAADAAGTWNLPKTAGKGSSGAVELYMSLSDQAAGTKLTGEVGAYASVNVLGFGRTIEKPLAKAEIAEVVAHGFARLDTADGLTLLPAGDFPTHVLRLNPKLEELLMGGDTKQAIAVAHNTVDRGVGKMEASEELLANEPWSIGSKPWKSQKPELERAEAAATAEVTRSQKAVKTDVTDLAHDRKCLEKAREKLTRDRKKKAALKPGEKVSSRAAMDDDVDARLDGYLDHLGRVKNETKLGENEMQIKIDRKLEEIAELESRIAEKEEEYLADRAKLATDINVREKATKKANLAGKSKQDVKADLGWRQRRLIEMYGTLQSAHQRADERAARGVTKTAKLEADHKTAQQRLTALNADPGASEIEKKFWTAQLAFLVEEIKRLKTAGAPPPLALSQKATAAFNRAKKAQPQALEKLSLKAHAKISQYEGEIEALTVALSENFAKMCKLAPDESTEAKRATLEAERTTLLTEMEGRQLQLAGALERAEAMEE